MNIRQAMYASAAHIEANPGRFRFLCSIVPDSTDCGSPGCAIGWVGYFLGVNNDLEQVCKAMGLPKEQMDFGGDPCREYAFYNRMNALNYGSWMTNAAQCAATLRLYADNHHPAPVQQPPNWSAIAAQRTVLPDAVSEDVRA